jgi:hypothetical protein
VARDTPNRTDLQRPLAGSAHRESGGGGWQPNTSFDICLASACAQRRLRNSQRTRGHTDASSISALAQRFEGFGRPRSVGSAKSTGRPTPARLGGDGKWVSQFQASARERCRRPLRRRFVDRARPTRFDGGAGGSERIPGRCRDGLREVAQGLGSVHRVGIMAT